MAEQMEQARKRAKADYEKEIGDYAGKLHTMLPWRRKEGDTFGWKHREIDPKHLNFEYELSKRIAERHKLDLDEHRQFFRQLEGDGRIAINEAFSKIPHAVFFTKHFVSDGHTYKMAIELPTASRKVFVFTPPSEGEEPALKVGLGDRKRPAEKEDLSEFAESVAIVARILRKGLSRKYHPVLMQAIKFAKTIRQK
ncbi:MAG: hypothetical protein ABIG96_01010 [Candidatus Micrarchaeota archaeon]